MGWQEKEACRPAGAGAQEQMAQNILQVEGAGAKQPPQPLKSSSPSSLKLETRNWLPKRLVLGGTSEEHLVHLPLSSRTQPFRHCLCLILLQMAARLPLLLQQRLEELLRCGLKGRFLSQPALKASWALLPGHRHLLE